MITALSFSPISYVYSIIYQSRNMLKFIHLIRNHIKRIIFYNVERVVEYKVGMDKIKRSKS
jgi:hypothetical protein